MKVFLLFAMGIFAVTPGYAEIYKCEDNGRTVFSQQPCGANVTKVTLSNEAAKIKLPDAIDYSAATSLCALYVSGWTLATGSRSQVRDEEDPLIKFVEARIEDSARRLESDDRFGDTLYWVGEILRAYAQKDPVVTPTAKRLFTRDCTVKVKEMLGSGRR